MNVDVPSVKRALLRGVLLVATFLTVPDAHGYEVKRDVQGNVIRWDDDEVELCLGVELIETFGVDRAVLAAEGAASAWSGIPGAPTVRISLAHTRSYDAARVSNCIHWARRWVGEGNELALTYTASDDDGIVHAGDIVLNGRQRFGWADTPFGGDRFDLQAVLTHEIGHLLGLEENPTDEASTMHPDIGPNEIFQRDITDDDRAGVEFVYSVESPRPVSACGVGRFGSESPGLIGALWALFLGIFLSRRRFVHFDG